MKQEKASLRWWRMALAAGTLFVTLALALTHAEGPHCLFRLMFRIPCPGCGLTRSLEDVWRADWALSFRHHPLGLPIFAFCWTILLSDLRKDSQFTERLLRLMRRPVFTRGLTALLLGLWGLRLCLMARGNAYFLW